MGNVLGDIFQGSENLVTGKYTVLKGKRYAARVDLEGFQETTTNQQIADKLVALGFHDVNVTGEGKERIAHGTWSKEDASIALPPQVTEVKEVASLISNTHIASNTA